MILFNKKFKICEPNISIACFLDKLVVHSETAKSYGICIYVITGSFLHRRTLQRIPRTNKHWNGSSLPKVLTLYFREVNTQRKKVIAKEAMRAYLI